MMQQKEVFEAFRELGWTLARHDGERVCLKNFSDRVLSIVPQLRKMSDKQKLNTNPSVSTDEFSAFCTKISERPKSGEPLAVDLSAEATFYSPSFSLADLKKIDKKLSSWAQTQDLNKSLADLIELPTDAVGALPLRHLAALAITGDVEKLKSYQASFEVGDRLGFVPYVTKDYIDRAVKLAEETVANS